MKERQPINIRIKDIDVNIKSRVFLINLVVNFLFFRQ